jgi:hypothetical protein
MAVTVTMACGCKLETDGEAPPICESHKERRVQGVMTSRQVRITAVECDAKGPLVIRG